MTDPMELVGEGSALSRFGHQAAPMDTKSQRAEARKAMREAAACIRELVEWRPIETAPRDGTAILIWDGRDQTTAAWSSSWNTWDLCVAGSYASDGWCDATHWLPLPPAPGAEG